MGEPPYGHGRAHGRGSLQHSGALLPAGAVPEVGSSAPPRGSSEAWQGRLAVGCRNSLLLYSLTSPERQTGGRQQHGSCRGAATACGGRSGEPAVRQSLALSGTISSRFELSQPRLLRQFLRCSSGVLSAHQSRRHLGKDSGLVITPLTARRKAPHNPHPHQPQPLSPVPRACQAWRSSWPAPPG